MIKSCRMALVARILCVIDRTLENDYTAFIHVR